MAQHDGNRLVHYQGNQVVHIFGYLLVHNGGNSTSYLEKTDARLILQNLNQKDHLRKAVRLMGNTNVCQDIKIHTGWIRYKDEMVFLSNAGAIGASGIDKDLKTHEDYGGPTGYTLSLVSQQTDFELFRPILVDLLSVTEPQVTYPLLAAAFRAPLYSMIPTDFALGVIGKTGSMKSTMASLFLNFFGSEFSVSNLPENFGSTPNSIERKTFLHKDVVLVIDDYVVGEITSFNGERIFRSIGNRSGRGRLTKDISLRTSFTPRGMIVFTGEDMNLRQSIRARMILTYSEAKSINKKVLTALQKVASQGTFTQIMGEYIKWLAPNYEKFQSIIKEDMASSLELFQNELLHNRIAPNLSSLFVGIKFFVRFCAEKNILSVEKTRELEQEAFAAFKSLVKVQLEHQSGSDPVENFLMCLRGAIETNKAHIKIEQESLLRVLGRFLGYKNLSQISGTALYQAMGEKLGVIKRGELWLQKDKAMMVIKEYARNRNVKFDISENMLGRHLRDGGWLTVDEGRTDTKRTVDGNRSRCWVFNNWIDVLEPDIHESIKNADSSTKAMLDGLFGAPIAPLLSSSSASNNQTQH